MHGHDHWRGNRESAMPSGEQANPHTSAAVGRGTHPWTVGLAAPSRRTIVLSILCSRPVERRRMDHARCAMVIMIISGPGPA